MEAVVLAEQLARGVRGTAWDAWPLAVGGACRTCAAAREECHRDALTVGDLDPNADGFDPSRRFVSQEHRNRPYPDAVHD
jgi:hypothetical protein